MNLIKNFIEKDCDFSNYDDLRKNFKIKKPDNFNFAFDVVDVYAEKDPEKRAIVWCDDKGGDGFVSAYQPLRHRAAAGAVYAGAALRYHPQKRDAAGHSL